VGAVSGEGRGETAGVAGGAPDAAEGTVGGCARGGEVDGGGEGTGGGAGFAFVGSGSAGEGKEDVASSASWFGWISSPGNSPFFPGVASSGCVASGSGESSLIGEPSFTGEGGGLGRGARGFALSLLGDGDSSNLEATRAPERLGTTSSSSDCPALAEERRTGLFKPSFDIRGR